MPALAEVLLTAKSSADPRGCDLPTCPVCVLTHGRRGGFRIPERQCDQLSLDLRHLRLWLRNKAFGQTAHLQLNYLCSDVTVRPTGARLFFEILKAAIADRCAGCPASTAGNRRY